MSLQVVYRSLSFRMIYHVIKINSPFIKISQTALVNNSWFKEPCHSDPLEEVLLSQYLKRETSHQMRYIVVLPSNTITSGHPPTGWCN